MADNSGIEVVFVRGSKDRELLSAEFIELSDQTIELSVEDKNVVCVYCFKLQYSTLQSALHVIVNHCDRLNETQATRYINLLSHIALNLTKNLGPY
jgi:hypothetical protein